MPLTEDSDARFRFSPAFWRAYTAAFVALTLVYAVVLVIAGSPFAISIRSGVAAIFPNAVLGTAAVQVARNALRGRERSSRFILSHASAVVFISLFATAGWAVIVSIDQWIGGVAFSWQSSRIVILFETLISGLVQIALLGATHAWLGAQRFAAAEALRARAEIALLRSQLNPHFMMNTLHAMLGLVRREPAQVEGALEKLGELLRFGLHVHQASVDQISLREEWAFVTNYLALEKMRFGDRLHVTSEAGDGAFEIPVPPFALQPLVENAITHAVSPRREGGTIRIAARATGGRLILEVEDDGPGTSESLVLASPRLGLRLLRERLRVLYGSDARIEFQPVSPRGLLVRLDLPDDGCAESVENA